MPAELTVATVAPLARLRPSPNNPRKHFAEESLKELAESIRVHGVLQPLLVRLKGDAYEIVAGERRYRAAKLAGLASVPVTVREIDDRTAAELAVLENVQRSDLTPLEEADGYELLHRRHRYTVEEIAAKIGKSPAYVYARLKLNALTKEARAALEANRITAEHAILLARLKPSDQARALGDEASPGPVFRPEQGLDFEPEEKAIERGRLVPVSVRELKTWIDRQVRLDEAPDPMLFPAAAAAVAETEASPASLLPVTFLHQVPPDAKLDGVRTYGPASMRRADGGFDPVGYRASKPCKHAQRAIVVVGQFRGEVIGVCTAKTECRVHWGDEIKRKAAQAKGGADGAKAREAQREEHERHEAQVRAEKEARERWEKALPAIRAALLELVNASSAAPGGILAPIVIKACRTFGHTEPKDVPAANSVEGVIRLCAFLRLWREVGEWNAHKDFPKRAKALGIDLKRILDEAAPLQAPAKTEQPKRRARKAGAT